VENIKKRWTCGCCMEKLEEIASKQTDETKV
jgi:hypothetical protein